MKQIKISDIILSAIFIAIIPVISQFSFMTPFGVPISFQVFAISLTGYILGTKLACFSVFGYIFLGLVGIPVFSGFMGGAQHIIGATGGFIIGFIAIAVLCGISKKTVSLVKRIGYGIVGLLICHIIGIIQFMFITKTSIISSLIAVSVPFLPKDLILVILAEIFSRRVLKLRIKP